MTTDETNNQADTAMSEEACRNCKHWRRNAASPQKTQDGREVGNCFFNPPTLVMMPDMGGELHPASVGPPTAEDQSCGRFEEGEPRGVGTPKPPTGPKLVS